MTAILGKKEYGVKKTGVTCTVPNNHVAKLMYYLSCICNVINLDPQGKLSRFKNYANYQNLDQDDLKALLVLCAAIQPKNLLNKCIFLAPQLCEDCSNQFYEISEANSFLAISSNLIININGQSKKIQKIMAFKMSWLENNFVNPFKALAQQLTKPKPKPQQLIYVSNEDCIIM